jgi:uncharacterized membrane protein YoaK (UPF0700 family)
VPAQQTPRIAAKAWLALMLALTAGCVDAVSYLVLWKVFTAHMSGNSVSAIVHAGEANASEAFHRGFPIPLFVFGIAAGAALSEALARTGRRRIFSVAVALEAVLLLLLLLWGGSILRDGRIPEQPGWRFQLLVALPTVAMGLQNAGLRRVGNVTVRTTYISGMLCNFAEQGVQYLFWLRDHWSEHRGRPNRLLRLSLEQPPFGHLCLQGGIWLAFVIGALFGVWVTLRWGLLALLGPIACLAIIAVCDIVNPIYPPHEGAQRPEWR